MCKIDGVLAENPTQYSQQFGIEKKLVRRIRKKRFGGNIQAIFIGQSEYQKNVSIRNCKKTLDKNNFLRLWQWKSITLKLKEVLEEVKIQSVLI